MKKLLLLFLVATIISALVLPVIVSAKTKTAKTPTSKDLVGRLVLQTESGNKLWYVDAKTKERWYLHNDADLYLLISTLGVTPTTKDFAKLATNKKYKTPNNLLKKYGGQIIISPKNSDNIFYLNKPDGIIYQITSFNDFYKETAKVIAIPSSDKILRLLAMNIVQDTYDPAFYGIAYVKYDGFHFLSHNHNSQRVLPLASLSKLMTALVFLDTNLDWDKEIIITQEEIDYPCTLQLCGTTSEINLKTGDRIKIKDLWAAMLSASSNQSAVILADNSGLTREEFVQKMNEKAKSLGLVKTKFVEMSGLSADNVSTAEEFAKIAQMAFLDGRISDATSNTSYFFNVIQADGSLREVTVKNRNYSLLAMGPRASKSGYLVEAQRNAVVEKDGQIIVALHLYSLAQRNSVIKNLLGDNMLSLAN